MQSKNFRFVNAGSEIDVCLFEAASYNEEEIRGGIIKNENNKTRYTKKIALFFALRVHDVGRCAGFTCCRGIFLGKLAVG